MVRKSTLYLDLWCHYITLYQHIIYLVFANCEIVCLCTCSLVCVLLCTIHCMCCVLVFQIGSKMAEKEYVGFLENAIRCREKVICLPSSLSPPLSLFSLSPSFSSLFLCTALYCYSVCTHTHTHTHSRIIFVPSGGRESEEAATMPERGSSQEEGNATR